jgi:hypothetical protein
VRGRSAADSLLLLVAVIVAVAYFGPVVAQRLAVSLGEIGVSLAPLAVPVLGVVLVLLVVRLYWSRW